MAEIIEGDSLQMKLGAWMDGNLNPLIDGGDVEERKIRKRLIEGLLREGGSSSMNDYTKLFKRDPADREVVLDGHCCCGMEIKWPKYVRNVHTMQIVEIGSCCIHRFGIDRRCLTCNEVHRNTSSNNMCNTCRAVVRERDLQLRKEARQALSAQRKIEKEQEKIKEKALKKTIRFGSTPINFGKHLGKTYNWVLFHHPDYFRWLIDYKKEDDEKYCSQLKRLVNYHLTKEEQRIPDLPKPIIVPLPLPAPPLSAPPLIEPTFISQLNMVTGKWEKIWL